jgi:hypothetical protein
MYCLAKRAVPILVALVLSACGSTTKVTKPIDVDPAVSSGPRVYQIETIERPADVPEAFVSNVQGRLDAELKERGLLGDDKSATHRVQVRITEYRMRHGVARVMLGVLAGKDGVKSTVKVLDRKTGELIGESDVSTFNAAAIGGPGSIAEMHGEEIVDFLAGNRTRP